ncbi:MAG: hypothetical protein QGG64_21200 [Candidatus Latescibacteria bacterium]|jgi:hypothetical protein|nr:hypothetical protein [Candidatus Latescibacterota bacterium]
MKKWFVILLAMGALAGCQKNEAPTGVSLTDVEGVWVGNLSDVTLLGRTLSGDVDFRFQRRTFEIQFFDPPPGQAEQLKGDWEFDSGKMVLTLQSSFPIAGDVGATDSLFVSILNNQMSMQTQGGSSILLQRLVTTVFHDVFPPVFGIVSRTYIPAKES